MNNNNNANLKQNIKELLGCLNTDEIMQVTADALRERAKESNRASRTFQIKTVVRVLENTKIDPNFTKSTEPDYTR